MPKDIHEINPGVAGCELTILCLTGVNGSKGEVVFTSVFSLVRQIDESVRVHCGAELSSITLHNNPQPCISQRLATILKQKML